MRHFQRLKNVVLNICVERFSGHTLQNIAGKRRSVIGIGWRCTGGKDSDRQMFLKIFIERRKVGSRRNKKFLHRLLETRSVGHDVAQCNRLGIGGRDLEIEIVIDIAIQVELSQLNLLHDPSPVEQF